MKTLFNKSIIAALSFLFVIAFSPMASAAENPFGMSNTVDMQLADNHKEGKCGEGKCGEGKCGEGKKDRKCDDDKKGKCGEGKCGAEMKGKCGEGKCGGSNKSKSAEPKCGGSE